MGTMTKKRRAVCDVAAFDETKIYCDVRRAMKLKTNN